MIGQIIARSTLRAAPLSRFSVSHSALAAARPHAFPKFDRSVFRFNSSSAPLSSDDPSLQPTQSNPQMQASSHTPEAPPHSSLPLEPAFSVYLSNLAFSATESLIHDFISQRAPVVKIDLVRNPDGNLRGFGFAKFHSADDANAAVEALDGAEFLGRSLRAQISVRRPVLHSATNQLFMAGFPTEGVSEDHLRQALADTFGLVPAAIRLHKFPGGPLKGTGHIEYTTESDADAVLAKLAELGPGAFRIGGAPIILEKARPLLRSFGQGGTRGAFGSGGYDRGAPRAPGAYGGGYGGAPYGGQGRGSYGGGGYNNGGGSSF